MTVFPSQLAPSLIGLWPPLSSLGFYFSPSVVGDTPGSANLTWKLFFYYILFLLDTVFIVLDGFYILVVVVNCSEPLLLGLGNSSSSSLSKISSSSTTTRTIINVLFWCVCEYDFSNVASNQSRGQAQTCTNKTHLRRNLDKIICINASRLLSCSGFTSARWA